MTNYDIEIGASNIVHLEATTRREIKELLKGKQGRVSVADNRTCEEIYFGTPEQVISLIDLDLEQGLV